MHSRTVRHGPQRSDTVAELRGTLSISIYFELGGLKVAKTICQVVLRSDGD